MKKIILVFAAIAISAGAFAQRDSMKREMSPRNMHNTQIQHLQSSRVDKSHPDGVMMQNGKIMMVKKGQMTTLDHDMTMSNGTKIMTDGSYTPKDGTTLQLKEGQHMDMSGNLSLIKPDKDNKMYLVPDSTRKKEF